MFLIDNVHSLMQPTVLSTQKPSCLTACGYSECCMVLYRFWKAGNLKSETFSHCISTSPTAKTSVRVPARNLHGRHETAKPFKWARPFWETNQNLVPKSENERKTRAQQEKASEMPGNALWKSSKWLHRAWHVWRRIWPRRDATNVEHV